MGSDREEAMEEYVRSMHGALLSLAEEMRARLNELSRENASTRAAIDALAARVATAEGNHAKLGEDVARVARVLDDDSAGALQHIRSELDEIRQTLSQTSARVLESELSVLDAVLARSTRPAGATTDG